MSCLYTWSCAYQTPRHILTPGSLPTCTFCFLCMSAGLATVMFFLELYFHDLVDLPAGLRSEEAVAYALVPLFVFAAISSLIAGIVGVFVFAITATARVCVRACVRACVCVCVKTNTHTLLSATTFCFAVVLGGQQASDRTGGRHKVFVMSAAGIMCISTIVLVFVRSFYGCLVVAAVFGAGYGCFTSVDFALVLDVLPSDKDRAKDLAIWHQALVLPQLIATPIGLSPQLS